MDHAAASLKSITESGDYVRIPSVPLFPAHDEFDGEGNLIRSFDSDRLKQIANRNNDRIAKTGDLSPIGPGHSLPADAPETMQPPVWGYAANFKVAPFGSDSTPTIHGDFYMKRTVEDHEGREFDGMKALKSMPRRSVEMWVKDAENKPIPGYIDRIAVLRQTPKMDLGLLAYSKASGTTTPITNQRKLYGSPTRQRSLAAAERGGKLCYSMETPMPMDPTAPASAMDMPNDDPIVSKVIEALKQFPGLAKLMEPAPAAPPAEGLDGPPMGDDLGAPPGDLPPPDGEPMKFAKGNPRSIENRLVYLEKQNADLLAKLKAADKAREDEKISYSKANAESIVDALERDGFMLDRDEEVLHFSKLPLGEAREKREGYIRTVYKTGSGSRHLPPAAFVTLPDSKPSASGKARLDYSKAETDRAVTYASEHGVSFSEALTKIAAK